MNIVDAIQAAAVPVAAGTEADAVLFEQIGDARLVLIGEASHGTREFYAERARITRRLIAEHGFQAVAVEADWPDAYRVNLYVRGRSSASTAGEALAGFDRFPRWMWRNTEVLQFVEWLREHNARADRPAGFYGLDLYSLFGSIAAVVAYLDKVDPEAAARARRHYGCFDHFGRDAEQYAYGAGLGLTPSCEEGVLAELLELRNRAAEYAARDGRIAADEFFHAEQNARLAVNAERYYRTMTLGRVESWNQRDRHMAETLDALCEHLRGREALAPRTVVWAHNSHLGDARATAMGASGELNLGQLVRERHGGGARLIGFTTHEGTVTAASDWGGETQRMRVRPSLDGSVERLFHRTGIPHFLLRLDGGPASDVLRDALLERAIGVIYRPETERWSHYFEARLAGQFDAVVHIDTTTALEPLDEAGRWTPDAEVPETFPSGV